MFRNSSVDDGGSDDDSKLPLYKDNDQPATKKAHTIWSDTILEQTLSEEGSQMRVKQGQRVARGVESFDVPGNVAAVSSEKIKEIMHNPSSQATGNDPFGEVADLSAVEGFGVQTFQHQQHHTRGKIRGRGDSGNQSRGRGRGHSAHNRGRGSDRGQSSSRVLSSGRVVTRGRGCLHGVKRSWGGNARVNDPRKLISGEYSFESLMTAELTPGISLAQLGVEIAEAFGESDVGMITKIVEEIGEDKAFDLFNETRQVESAGGMKVNDGSRRRTPGGVFITLFKSDTDVAPETKSKIFDISRMEQRKFNKGRRKGNSKNTPNKVTDSAEQVDLKPLPDVTEVLKTNTVPDDLDMIEPEIDLAEMES